MSDLALFGEELRAPSGKPERFTTRYHLTGFGIEGVWEYGVMTRRTPSGRILFRGSNGAGKTTALEILVPFLLDLDPRGAKLRAGKSRSTTLAQIMGSGQQSNRVGFAWLEFTSADGDVISYGARLNYRAEREKPVILTGFTIPGIPGIDMPLLRAGDLPIVSDRDLGEIVAAAGGRMFTSTKDYRSDIARTLFDITADELMQVCEAIREVRDPAKLSAMNPEKAAAAVKESLPTIDADIRNNVATVLRSVESARQHVQATMKQSLTLTELNILWSRYVAGRLLAACDDVSATLKARDKSAKVLRRAERDHDDARGELETARTAMGEGSARLNKAHARITALTSSEQTRNADAAMRAGQAATEASRRAASGLQALTNTVTYLTNDVDDGLTSLEEVIKDFTAVIDEACETDTSLARVALPVMVSHDRNQPLLVAGTTVAMPDDATVIVDTDATDAITATWNERVVHHQSVSVTATSLISDHQAVDDARAAATQASDRASQKQEILDRAQTRQRERREDVDTERATLTSAINTWCETNPDLVDTEAWEDMTDATAADVPRIATIVSDHARSIIDEYVAQIVADVKNLRAQAATLKSDAVDLRTRAARARTEGQLLPIPRPDGVPSIDESLLLGSALNWHADVPQDVRDRIEDALARSGVLGARMGDSIAGPDWRIDPDTATVAHPLSTVITIEDDHPHAAFAAAALARITLADTAHDGAALTIGRDGSYQVGLIRWTPEAGTAPHATHVGRDQRYAAMLAQAAAWDAEADDLDMQAKILLDQAEDKGLERAQWLERAKTFPRSSDLVKAINAWELAATEASDASAVAEQAFEERDIALSTANAAQREWRDRAKAAGLPLEIGDVRRAREGAQRKVSDLKSCLSRLAKILKSMTLAADRMSTLASRRGALHGDAGRVNDEAALADRLRTEEETLTATLDKSAQEIIAEVERAQQERDEAERAQGGLYEAEKDAVAMEASTKMARQHAEEEAARHEPAVDAAVQALRARMTIVVAQTASSASDAAVIALDAADALAQCKEMADTLLDGATPLMDVNILSRRKEELAVDLLDGWMMSEHEEAGLRMYRLNSGEETMPLPVATERARADSERAQRLMDEESNKNMRDLVLNGIPKSLYEAWNDLRAWVNDTNLLMKDASASSGVRVRLDVQPLKDLAETERIVLELGCMKSASARTADERTQLEDALNTLLRASDRGEEDIDEFVQDQLDIRNLVRVRFMIVRTEDGKPEAWTPRTGLSNGESVLVVIAPLLAGLAAKFNQMGPGVLRIAALDEVPAAVDARGRDGLARYIAALDLDLVATSHGWDGAPGAWDGIDIMKLRRVGDIVVESVDRLRARGTSLPGDDDIMEEDARWI